MNAFVLKIIACITMFIDHIGYAIFNGNASWFNYVGRLAFPIFAFQISEGYSHTHNIKKYLSRLFIFAIISQIPFMLFHSIINGDFAINVIFTLFFGLISIIVYDKYNKFVGITVSFSLGIIAQILKFDYGFYGVFITLLFYIFKNSKVLTSISFVLATCLHYLYNILIFIYDNGLQYLKIVISYYLPYAITTSLSIIIILLYNKKKGPNTRYLLYLFYPLHMLLIYGISFII